MSTMTGWILTKSLPEAKVINEQLMWREAFGILKNQLHGLQGEGLFTPQRMDKTCEHVPSAAQSCPTLHNLFSSGQLKRSLLGGSEGRKAALKASNFKQVKFGFFSDEKINNFE